MKEQYYSVRIGTPGRDAPYFMLGQDKKTPALFQTRIEAEMNRPKESGTKVVRVWVTTNAQAQRGEGAA